VKWNKPQPEIVKQIVRAVELDGRSIPDIARHAGLSVWSLYHMRNGYVIDPRISTITALANALGFSVVLDGQRWALRRHLPAPPPPPKRRNIPPLAIWLAQ
jgi:DNA-binding phage protein